jgi:multidrug efflux system membrane fusion protein
MMRALTFVVLMSSLFTTVGCERKTPPIAPAEAQAVPVSKPVTRLVTDFVDFTGRANAVDTVTIIPRVTGYLVKIPFKEGSEVKKREEPPVLATSTVGLMGTPVGQGPLFAASALEPGRTNGDLLFEIDPRPYKAQLDAAKAKLALSKASLKLAQVTNVRFKDLAKKEASAVSQQDLDKYQAQEDEAVANLDLAKANLEAAQLNLDWTQVYSPINGKISRFYLTSGNLVTQDQTLLTTILSLEPMYAFFDMDEPTYLRIKRAVNEGKVNLPGEKDEVPVLMGLQGEEGYPHRGYINFVDNQVFPTTGSISWRGVFPNPKPPGGTRLLAPGMFLRIRLPIGQPHKATLVIDRAVWSDQGLKNVYVVDAENKIQSRRVSTGSLQEDGLRVVEGLQEDDWVVVGALQQVRPRMVIRPDQIPMPTLGAAASPPPPNPTGKTPPKKDKG